MHQAFIQELNLFVQVVSVGIPRLSRSDVSSHAKKHGKPSMVFGDVRLSAGYRVFRAVIDEVMAVSHMIVCC